MPSNDSTAGTRRAKSNPKAVLRRPFPGCEKCVMAACVKVLAHESAEVAHAESMSASQMTQSEVGPLPSNAKSVDIRKQ
jgi:hypothetical protein